MFGYYISVDKRTQMKRSATRKMIGVSVLSLALLSALPAAANAAQFTAAEYPATVDGSAAESMSFGFGGSEVVCSEGIAAGSLAAASSTLEYTPSFSSCTSSGTAATVSTNGCSFASTLEGEEEGTLGIACPEGQSMSATWAFGQCHAHYAPNGVFGPAKFKNDSWFKQDITEIVTATKVTYTLVDTGILCPEKSGHYNNGVLTGRWTLEAREGLGELQDFHVG